MYHPSRGGVRGGRDQFNWDDVKADKHRENYIGHSIKAPVGRWQKGKDLHWYVKGNSQAAADAAREEIARIKEEEEQLMREALGLAPKREKKPRGNNIDKHEAAELFRKGVKDETAPDQAVGERVEGLGFAPAPKPTVVKRDANEDKAKSDVASRDAHLPQRHGREVVPNGHIEGGRSETDDHKRKRTAETEGDKQARMSRAESPSREHSLHFVERQGGSCDSDVVREPGARHHDTHSRVDSKSANDVRDGETRVRDRKHERDKDSGRQHQARGSSSHGSKDRKHEKRYPDSRSDKDASTSRRKNRDVTDDGSKDRRHSRIRKDHSDRENGSPDRQ